MLHNSFLAQSAYAFAMPADFEFLLRLLNRTAGGVTSQEGQLVNSRPPEIHVVIYYKHTYLRMSFHRKFATA